MLLITNTINRMRLTMLHIIGTFCFILNTSINTDLSASFYHTLGAFSGLRIAAAVQWIASYSSAICSTAYSGKFTSRSSFLKSAIEVRTAISGANFS